MSESRTETAARLQVAIEKCRLDYIGDALMYGYTQRLLPRLVEHFERERLSYPLHGGLGCIG